MMVNFKIMVFWFMTSPDLLDGTNISNEPDATISYHKNGSSRFVWNVGSYQQNHMALLS